MPAAEGDAGQRAAVLLRLGRPADAERLLRTALRTDAESAGLLRLLAEALLELDRPAEARDVAERAVRASPNDAFALSCLAAAASRQRDFRTARSAVERALAQAPYVGDLHRQQAEVLLASGRRDEALAAGQRARELDPDSAEIAAAFGQILLATGHEREARAEIGRALRLDPESARAHRTEGLLHLRRGGGQPSILRFREALRIDPNDQAARHGLATALKTRNPVFRGLLLLEVWVETLSPGRRWAVRLAPFVLSRIFIAMHTTLGNVLLGALGLFIALTWATEPISNLTLMCSRTERPLLTRAQRTTALAFLAVLAIAVACVVGTVAGSKSLSPYALGFGLWAFVVGSLHTVSGRRTSRILLALAAAAAASGAIGLVFVALGLHTGAVAAAAVLICTGVPALWITALAA